jgi:hypothetical protein
MMSISPRIYNSLTSENLIDTEMTEQSNNDQTKQNIGVG